VLIQTKINYAICRKKVLDFYQRTSLTAYCTAFSYRPLPLPPDKSFSEMYLELPADCRQLYSKLCRSPTPQPWTSTTHKIRQPQFHSSGKYILPYNILFMLIYKLFTFLLL